MVYFQVGSYLGHHGCRNLKKLLTQQKQLADLSLPIFLSPQVFGFLLDKPDTEKAYFSLVENIKTLFAFVEVKCCV